MGSSKGILDDKLGNDIIQMRKRDGKQDRHPLIWQRLHGHRKKDGNSPQQSLLRSELLARIPPTGTVTENIAVISKSVPIVLSGSYVKTVLRHIWKNYGELTDDAWYAPKFRELYARRKATIKKNMACGIRIRDI